MSPTVTFPHIGQWSSFRAEEFASVLTNEDFAEHLTVSIWVTSQEQGSSKTARGQTTPAHADLLWPMGMAAIWEQTNTLTDYPHNFFGSSSFPIASDLFISLTTQCLHHWDP